MSALCPRCNVLEKNPKCGYCNPCNRALVKERYHKARQGKPKGLGWRGISFSASVKP